MPKRRALKAGPPMRIRKGETLWLARECTTYRWFQGSYTPVLYPKGKAVTVVFAHRGRWGRESRFAVRPEGAGENDWFYVHRGVLTRVHCEPERRGAGEGPSPGLTYHSQHYGAQVQVTWLYDTPERSNLSQGQCDGGYNLDQFDLVQCSEVERRGDGAKG